MECGLPQIIISQDTLFLRINSENRIMHNSNTMKKLSIYLYLALFCFCALNTMSQSIERSVFASAGKTVLSGNNQWNFTIGESVTKYLHTSNTKVTQGFQQGSVNGVNNELVIDPSSSTGGIIQCTYFWAPEYPIVQSSCGNYDMGYNFTDTTGTACSGTMTVTWTIFDECGNSTNWVQTYYFEDTVPPVLVDNLPPVVYLSCDDESVNYTPIFEDNCLMGAIDVQTTLDETTDACGRHDYFTWTVTDMCGNSATYAAEVHYLDNDAPTVDPNALTEIFVGCDDPFPPQPDFNDNCDGDYIVEEELIQNGTDITRNYTVYDACGNTMNFSQVIHLTCCVEPYVIFDPANVIGECGTLLTPEQPVFGDDVDTNLDITYTVNEQPFGCGYAETYIWTATNDCGASVTALATVSYEDTQPPFVYSDEPTDIYIGCDDGAPLVPNFQDNCDTDLTISITQEIVYQGVLQRTWSAFDDCGYGTSFTQYIHQECCLAPVLVVQPDDLYIECGQSYVAPEPTFEDPNGGSISITSEVSFEVIPCGSDETHTFTATNECGASATASVHVIITDTQEPYAIDGQQTDFIVECSDVMPSAPEFEDYCDLDLDVVLESESNVNNTITRVWKATDDCGYTATFTQTIYASCCTEPALVDLPDDVYVACGDGYDIPVPTFEDPNGGELTIETSHEAVAINCGVMHSYTTVATNNCGLSNSATINVIVTDYESPYPAADQSSEFFVECGMDMPDAPMFEDVCDLNLTVVLDSETNINNVITRNWVATDDCGYTADFTQIIHVSCCEAPYVVENVEPISIECGDEYIVPLPAFEDSNGSDLEISFDSTEETMDCGQMITYTYTATNDCGLSVSADVVVTITDTQSPYLLDGELEEFFIQCSDDLPQAPLFGDACDQDLNIVLESDLNNGDVLVRTWSATDDCGNTISFSQIIHVSCCTAPVVIEVPETQFVECGNEVSVVAPVFEGEEGEELSISHDMTTESLDCGYVETHTWTATNSCGLSVSASVDVVFEDHTAPVIDAVFANVEISCSDAIPAPLEIDAIDNCDQSVNVNTTVEVIEEDDCGNTTWKVNYEAIDDCGNSSSASYLIIMEDLDAPEFKACPENLVLECGAKLPDPEVLIATDACDSDVEVVYEEFVLDELMGQGVVSECALLTPILPANNPCGYPVNWALSMFGLPKAHRYYYVSEGSLTQMEDGTLQLQATFNNSLNPANGWIATYHFGTGMTWDQWSAQSTPHSFKADCGGIAANHFDWMYYLMLNTPGVEMVGFGGYSQSTLSTTHSPSNGYFGFQWGNGANNYNAAENGFGGWLRYVGQFYVNGTPYGTNNGNISGTADLALELNCCESTSVVRQWTATDCSGNTTTCVQEITIGTAGDKEFDQNSYERNALLNTENSANTMSINLDPNPTGGITTLRFNTIEHANTEVQIFSTTGELVALLMDSETESDVDFVLDFDTATLANGVYFCKVTNGSETHTNRLIVTH